MAGLARPFLAVALAGVFLGAVGSALSAVVFFAAAAFARVPTARAGVDASAALAGTVALARVDRVPAATVLERLGVLAAAASGAG